MCDANIWYESRRIDYCNEFFDEIGEYVPN